jgi:hypothetical protein
VLIEGLPVSRQFALIAILLSAAATSRLIAQDAPLASEPFSSTAGALHGTTGGAGWAAAWEVQNNSTTVPGYNVAGTTPLSATTGNYAVGGLSWQTSGRTLDTTAAGPFGSYLSNGLIGSSGRTLYFSFLLRVTTANVDEVSATLHASANPAWWISTPGVAAGYFGGGYWGMKVKGTVYRSSVPMVVGQTAQLTLRIDFGPTNTVSLSVDSATPVLTATTTNSVAFRSLAFYGGSGTNQGAIDEIRIGSTYAAVAGAPATTPAPTGLTATAGNAQVALTWTAVTGATSYQVLRAGQAVATVTTPGYVDTGLVNGTTYSYAVTASGPSGVSAPSASVSSTPQVPAPAAHPLFGTNLAAVADYSRELPFVDAFKSARPWISQAQGKTWGQGGALALDANGWVTSFQPGQYAETILLDNALDDQAHYPTGNYTLLYDGEGTLAFDLQSATIVSQTPGRMVVNVPAGGNGIYLMLTATNPANPLRNIRFLMPGSEGSYQSQPFNPAFLQSLQTYRALRFMEWSLVNNSTVQQWSERPAPADYTYSWRGVPLEVQIQLANALKLTPWFHIPAMAGDNYVQNFAAVVNSRLDPSLSFYLEYSNETWNAVFTQNAYVRSQGLALGFSSDPTVATAAYTAYRSTQIFGIVRPALANPARMIRVIASQAENSWLSEQTLLFRNAYQQADALAIAPYFNCSDTATGGYGKLGDPAAVAQQAAFTVDQIIDIEQQHIDGCALQNMRSNAAVARKYGVKMVGYEGGQHLAGWGGAENNSTLTSLFKAANRSPRMYTLYSLYLQNWIAAGGDLFLHFTDVGAYTKWGSWGALEYQDQAPSSSPKFQAISVISSQYR